MVRSSRSSEGKRSEGSKTSNVVKPTPRSRTVLSCSTFSLARLKRYRAEVEIGKRVASATRYHGSRVLVWPPPVRTPPPPSRDTAILEALRDDVSRRARPPCMPEDQVSRILEMSGGLCNFHHLTALRAAFREAQNEYSKVVRLSDETHVFSVASTSETSIPPWRQAGRTAQYDKMVSRRHLLHHRLHTLHPLARRALSVASQVIPTHIVSLESHWELGLQEPMQFVKEFQQATRETAEMIYTKWYEGITRGLCRRGVMDGISHADGERLLNSLCSLVSVQMSQLMRRSVAHVLQVLARPSRLPRFQLRVELLPSGRLALEPSETELTAALHSLIHSICGVAQTWPRFGKENTNNIQIHLDEGFVTNAHSQLSKILDLQLCGLREHLSHLDTKFGALYGEQTSREQAEFVAEEREFDALSERVHHFRAFLFLVLSEPPEATFAIASLSKSELLTELQRRAKALVQGVVSVMEDQHQLESRSICEVFRDINARAEGSPESTEQLMATGEFMAHAEQTLLGELEQRIRQSVHHMSFLMRLRYLSPQHTYLNTETVQWLSRIQPTFARSATLYEEQRQHFERLLQQRTDQLNRDLEDTMPRLAVINTMCKLEQLRDYLEEARNLKRKIDEFEEEAAWINKEEQLFKFPLSTYPELDELKNCLLPVAKLLRLCNAWQRTHSKWMDGAFDELDAATIDSTTKDVLKNTQETQSQFRAMIKQQITDNNPRRLKGVLDDPDPSNLPAPLQLCHHMLQHLQAFKQQIPLVRVLCNPSLEHRHWSEMSSLLGDDVDIEPDAGSSLRKMIALSLSNEMLQKFEVISFGASKELALFETLTTMIAAWDNIFFTMENDPERDCNVLTKLDELQALLSDQLLRTQAMRGSAFAKPHAVKLREWHGKLRRAAATVQRWGGVQQLWRHLAPIFSCADIQHLMPSEDTLFKEVDVTFREAMIAVQEDSLVMHHAAREGVLEAFEHCVANLEIVNQGVGRYLEIKRRAFPRFFFLSNEEILAILSERHHPERIVGYLRKCLEGASGAVLDSEGCVKRLLGVAGEHLELEQPGVPWIKDGGRVELWLDQLVSAMKLAMQSHFERSMNCYDDASRVEWSRKWPMQLVLAVAKTKWTNAMEISFKYSVKYPMHKILTSLQEQISTSCNQLRGDMNAYERSVLQALTTADCHSLDVVRHIIDSGVKQATEFTWLSQFRMYTGGPEGLQGRLMYATQDYGWEFLTPNPCLIITPLTLRSFRALIAALQMGVGCWLQGPASSGKSDTVMALAGALGKQRVSVSCSPAMDHATIARVVQGVAGCGAWCLLDDVHHLSAGSLSVAAQHVLELTRACNAGNSTLKLQGCEPVRLAQPRCLLCITAAQKNSAHIPNNLRSLFRPLAMSSPDIAVVSEVRLLCCGFYHAEMLSRKLASTLQFCTSLLSKQPHYDFGMWTALRTVQVAGELRSVKMKDKTKEVSSHSFEEELVSQGLLRVLLPGLLPGDHKLFIGLLRDIFSNENVKENHLSSSVAFIDAVKQICEKRVLQSTSYFLSKVTELHDMLQNSKGIVLVGEPFSGKTQTIQVLADTLRLLGGREKSVFYETVNPRALTPRQMFGHFDALSAEWSDGVVPRILRELGLGAYRYGWIVLDGPVDSDWSETLHSALDGSCKMSLPSGEVIALSHGTTIIFEVSNLSQASPGTVSRCGCIHFSSEALGWRALMLSWLRQEGGTLWAQAEGPLVLELMEWMIPPCVEFIKQCKRLVETGTNNIIRTTACLFAMLLREPCNDPEAPKHVRIWVQAALMLAGAWAFGGTLERSSREAFDEMFKTLWRGVSTDHPLPSCLEGKVDVPVPSEGQLVDHSFMFKFKGAWKHWPDALRSLKMEEKPSLLQLTVPTVETARYLWLLEMHVSTGTPMLLVGPRDTGKSTLAQHFLLERMDPEHQPALVRLTHHATATLLQEEVMSHLSKRPDGGYGPTPGKKSCVVFVDDVGMPAHEKGGTQPALELLRQMLDHRAWFDQLTGARVSMQDILLLAALAPQNSGVSPRVLRHFNVFSISTLPDESVARIFSSVLHFALKNNGFASDVASVITAMVQSTIDVLTAASRKLCATPHRPHYALGLRDFQRIVLGCAQIRKENADNKRVMVRLWTHEVLRVVSDRLSFKNERNLIFELVDHSIKEIFKEQPAAVFEHLPKTNGQVTEESSNAIVFGNFLDNVDHKYVEITNNDDILNRVLTCLDEYNNESSAPLEVVLFPEAVQQVSRLCRVLCMPRGSALLLGKLGRGRQSLTRLAARVCGYRLIQPSLAATSNHGEWRECLKQALRQAGAENQETVFLVNETQLSDDLFLQDIHCVLSSGEIPNLFSIEEKQDIMETVMLDAQGGKRTIDLSALYVLAFFAARCQDKLHWVVCLEPTDHQFRTWLQRYPALLSHCTPMWFPEWPSSALEQISIDHTTNLTVEPDVKSLVVNACQRFHASARKLSEQFKQEQGRNVEVGTRSYVELLQLLCSLLAARQARTQRDRQRYIIGLEKLQLAATQVKRIQEELSSLQPKLADAALETTGMLEVIETETQKVCEASLLVRRDEAVANAQAAAAQELKSECETELAQAIPILEDAVAALNTLKPTDITLVKSMKNPPEPIKLVMAAVCVIRNIKPDRLNDAATGRKIIDYWGPSKKLLGDIAFLQQLKEFDKDNIPPPTIAKIRKDFINHSDFKPDIVANASSAAEGLCKWVRAMDMYDAVAKEVAPKKVKLEAAQQEYAATLAVLEEKRAQVRRLEQQLAELQSQFNAANSHKLQLEAEFRACAHKLERAEKLIGGLGGEKNRWAATAEILQTNLNTLIGDVILSSAVITYLGPFTSTYRQNCLRDWLCVVKELGIPCSENYNFCRVMGNELLIESWNLAGLPRDETSTQNAIIAQHSMRICLAIDPQRQANTWIRTMEKEHDLRVVKFPDSNFIINVKKCVEDGVPVLVEDLQDDELDTLIATLVNSDITLLAPPPTIIDDENSDEEQLEFRLYVTTPQSQPSLAAQVYCHTAVIDFTLPSEGLEDQLLGIIMAAERPALRLSRQQVVVEGARNKAALQEVEERILTTLSQSQGNILEDEAAVDILDTAKSLSEELAEKQLIAAKTLHTIAQFREEHQALARDTAAVFFTLISLPVLNSSYHFSLQWFLKHFSSSIRESSRMESVLPQQEGAPGRQERLFTAFVQSLCSQVTQAMFERDRLPFTLLLYLNILVARKEVSKYELEFLVKSSAPTADCEIDLKRPDWILPDTWSQICHLSKLNTFKELATSIHASPEDWKSLVEDFEVLTEEFASKYSANFKTSPFNSLLLTAVFHPHKVESVARRLVSAELKLPDLPSTGDLALAMEQSTCCTPIVCVLGPGADPSALLFPLAEVAEHTQLSSISMAPHQGPEAEAVIALAKQRGTWVCLHNCHLAGEWLCTLEELCVDLEDANPSFRLWITCNADAQLPTSVVQRAVKVACEAPADLRLSMGHSLTLQSPMFPECRGKEATFCRLAFGIAFLHALLQGRGQFGHLGWGTPYHFDDCDLTLASRQIWMLCRENRRVPLDAAVMLVGDCHYGGHISDPWDSRSLSLLLADCVNSSLLTQPGFCLASTATRQFKVPNIATLNACLTQIQNFPSKGDPEIYGVHARAGLERDLLRCKELLKDTSLTLGPHLPLISASKSMEISLRDVALQEKVEQILSQLPSDVVEDGKNPEDSISPLDAVLAAEKVHQLRVLRVARSSLEALRLVLSGNCTLTPLLEELTVDLAAGQVPFVWNVDTDNPSLQNFVSLLRARAETLQAWSNGGILASYWLTGLVCPDSFISAVKQQHSRTSGVPLCDLDLDFEVMSDYQTTTPPSEGAFIYGLYIDGAVWDIQSGHLKEQIMTAPVSPLPLLWLKPCKSPVNERGRYLCPVYRSRARGQAVASVLLNNGNESAKHWARRGVALYLHFN